MATFCYPNQKSSNIFVCVFSNEQILKPTLLGTCFATTRAGWFATASHVVDGGDSGLVILVPSQQDLSAYQDTTETSARYNNAKIERVDPIHDTAIISIPFPIAANVQIGGLDQTSVGSEVDLFGFPHSNYNRKVLTKQAADIGAKVLLENGGVKVKHAVINIQSRPGQSGSPVFLKNSLNIVGILVGSYAPGNSGISLGGIDPQTLHNTSHAVSAEYILRMLQ